MKNLIAIFIVLFSIYSINAQCPLVGDDTYNMFKIEVSDKKGKVATINTYTVENRTGNSVVFDTKLEDASGNDFFSSKMEWICDGTTLKMDLSNMQVSGRKGNMAELFGDDESDVNMDIKMESEQLEYPNKLAVGEILKDAYVKTSMANMVISNTSITNRKVAAKETITTPAGSFECYKITANINNKSAFLKLKTTQIEWYCPEIGFVVQSESYKKGKLETKAVLTELK